MNVRISLAAVIIRLGTFIQSLGRFIRSLALMVMRPDNLVEFTRRSYSQDECIKLWSMKAGEGLYPLESALLEEVPKKSGRALVLAMGGGREAIALARMGFQVTGLDFIPQMVHVAQENAVALGVEIEGVTQDMSHLEMPPSFFDFAWIGNHAYSLLPTRAKREDLLRRIRQTLRPGGYLLCSFHWDTRPEFSHRVELARRIFARLTRGNLWYETGDTLWGNSDFIHVFQSMADARAEFDAAGFTLVQTVSDEILKEGAALLKLAQ